MDILKKFQDHFLNTPVNSFMKGCEFTGRLAENEDDITKGIAALVGGCGGALMGGFKLISPTSIIETLMRSDEEIDRRSKEIWN